LVFQSLPSQAQQFDWPDENQCQEGSAASDVIEGWCIAIDRRRGNCIACHTFNISPWPINLPVAGNIAPPMVAMQGRFPDKRQLRMIIEDATVFNQESSMPPYLKHGILSTQEIELLVGFLLGI
jgi:sulfur-oxidizing protein SoxX